MKSKRHSLPISLELYEKIEKVVEEIGSSPYVIVRDAIEEYLDINHSRYNSSYVAECISVDGENFKINIDAPDKSYAIKKVKRILEKKAYNTDNFIIKIRKGMI